ncbi:hypothetical protein LC048_15360 [Mesobacillus subterraneus]|uniref:hypothetical protein n=1 Tax=Mesobacillus subterraneus TaxID=285983 RepID=UPI001CFD8FA5|nr:hypothetical protein [Mesobacillus subterraneus]WLR53877.1 hypothetical protein LC048_15360 [Mesobacillus subterraneus]
MKSFFDFIGRTEIEMYSRLSRNAETGDSDKEALFASAGGVEVSEFLGGDTRQATRGARRGSWTTRKADGPWSVPTSGGPRHYTSVESCF